ncbi:MAG: hypothetical protein NW201_00665 [Gemmatimonadales bacterium]|nr:hypothetical protein [Gemmatimonadales bacterium]
MEGIIIVSIVFGSIWGILRGPMGGAIAEAIRNSSLPEGGNPRELEAMRHDLEELRAQLAETQERLDFAERMLANGREAKGLPPAAK